MGAAASVEAILDSIAQPVWVVDHDGFVVFVNPAAIAALGYDHLDELRGRPGHEAIHYKYPDGSPFPEAECRLAEARKAGETLSDVEDWLVRRDGEIIHVTYSSAPFRLPHGLGSVTAFTDIEQRLRAEQAARERDVAQARAVRYRGSGPLAASARIPSRTIARWRRQASGAGCGMPLALPTPHMTSGMSSITTSGRIRPCALARTISSPVVTMRSSFPGQVRGGKSRDAAMISVNARSPAVFSAPNHIARVNASHGSSSVISVRT